MKREELLSSPQYWITEIQSQLYEEISNYLEENNLSKSDFAKELKVTRGYVSQVLKGDFNHKLSKFVELSLAVGKVPIVKWKDLSAVINEEKDETKYHTIAISHGGSYQANTAVLQDFPNSSESKQKKLINLNLNHTGTNEIKAV